MMNLVISTLIFYFVFLMLSGTFMVFRINVDKRDFLVSFISVFVMALEILCLATPIAIGFLPEGDIIILPVIDFYLQKSDRKNLYEKIDGYKIYKKRKIFLGNYIKSIVHFHYCVVISRFYIVKISLYRLLHGLKKDDILPEETNDKYMSKVAAIAEDMKNDFITSVDSMSAFKECKY